MDFNEYQEKASKVAIYPDCAIMTGDKTIRRAPYLYPVMGLCGEAGELANKVKKIARDKKGLYKDQNGEVLPDIKEAMKGEISDVLWYIQQICTEFDLKLEDVAKHNIEKLYDRKERGVLGGSGDNR